VLVSSYLVVERRVLPGRGPTSIALFARIWRSLAIHRDRVIYFRLAADPDDPDHIVTVVRYRDHAEFERLTAAIPPELRRELASLIIPGTLRRNWAEAVRDIENFTDDSGFVSILQWDLPPELVESFLATARLVQDRFMEIPGTVASRLLRVGETTFLLMSEYRDAAAAEAVVQAGVTAVVPPELAALQRSAFRGDVRLQSYPNSLPPLDG
jgi:quinol monooxygenase YgiN